MQKLDPNVNSLTLQASRNNATFAPETPTIQSTQPYTFSIDATVPPATDVSTIIQRADTVGTVQNMLADPQTSTLLLTGMVGSGKSTLAALVYRHLQQAPRPGLPTPRHLVWLKIGSYTTLPDVIAAILSRIDIYVPDFFFLDAEQQILLLLKALQRPQESAFIVLDQFERLLNPEGQQGLEGRGSIRFFLDMLQTNLGASRVLLTCARLPMEAQNLQNTHIRAYQVPPVRLVEGIALLQQHGVQGAEQDFSLAWQRCEGQVFALVLCAALLKLDSKLTLNALLNSPKFQPLWSGQILLNLIDALYHRLHTLPRSLLHALSLFDEPVPAEGIFMLCLEGEGHVDLPRVEQELAVLTQLSLVQTVTKKSDVPCYEMHPLLRQYVIERYTLDSSAQPSKSLFIPYSLSAAENPLRSKAETRKTALAAAHVQVAAYYQQIAEESPIPPEKRSSIHDVEPLLAIVRHLCLGGQWEQAFEFLADQELYESLVQWGAWNTLVGLYISMLPPRGVLTRYNAALICNYLGFLSERLGNYQQSWNYYQDALTLQYDLEDHHGAAVTLTNQGELLRSRGEVQKAFSNFEKALELNKLQPDSLIESVILHNLGILHHMVRNYEQALRYYQAALELMRELEDRYEEGTLLTDIGMLLYELGRQTEAVSVLRYTIQLRKSLHDPSVNSLEQLLVEIEQKKHPIKAEQITSKAKQAVRRGTEEFRQPLGEFSPVLDAPSEQQEPNVQDHSIFEQATMKQVPIYPLPATSGQEEPSEATVLFEEQQDELTQMSEEERRARLQQSMIETQRQTAISFPTAQNQAPQPLFQMSDEERCARMQQSLLETQRQSAISFPAQLPSQPSPMPPMSEAERFARMHQSLLETQRHVAIRPVERRQQGSSQETAQRRRKKRWEETSGSHEAVNYRTRAERERRLGGSNLWSDGSF